MSNETDIEYLEFRRCVLSYVELFCLHDWNVEVVIQELPDSDEQTRAKTWMNWTQRTARVIWNSGHREKSDSVCSQTPKQYAAHEVIHILLNALVMTAVDQRDFDSNCLNSEEHAVIRRVMKAINA